jgi:quinol monooxygenase YgiN
MIVEYLRYSIDEERRPAFEAAYERAEQPLVASPHCLRYELAQCVDEPGAYTVRIEWDSAEGHLQGFRRSAGFREFFEAVRPFVDDIEEMRHYHVQRVAS